MKRCKLKKIIKINKDFKKQGARIQQLSNSEQQRLTLALLRDVCMAAWCVSRGMEQMNAQPSSSLKPHFSFCACQPVTVYIFTLYVPCPQYLFTHSKSAINDTVDQPVITGKTNCCPFLPSKFLFCISVTLLTRAQTAGELQSPRKAMIQIIPLLCIFHPPAHPNWLPSYIQISVSAEEQTLLQPHTQQGLTQAAACSCSQCPCLQHNKHCQLPLLYHCLLFPFAVPTQVFGAG